MPPTAKQMAQGHTRFLDAYPQIHAEVMAYDDAVANALGLELETMRTQATAEAIVKQTNDLNIDPFEFLLRFAVDTEEERKQLLDSRKESIRRALFT
ncbi:hypothetical protein YS110_17695 [Acidovorax sp. YS12]|nr:hypothetical protein YS110_17695 [Acidovorax sp. YS12]